MKALALSFSLPKANPHLEASKEQIEQHMHEHVKYIHMYTEYTYTVHKKSISELLKFFHFNLGKRLCLMAL